MDWASWLPLGIELETSALLIMTAMCTSFITAAMGIGGGLVLLMVMATCIPLELLIPVHGLVQLGSNSNRLWIARQHVHWSVTRLFMLGGIVGSVVASLFVTSLPVAYIQLLMGAFVLFLVWFNMPGMGVFPHRWQVFFGATTTLLSMFVGATGPLVAAALKAQNLSKHQIVGTFAACMTFQHGIKIALFTLLGVALLEWLPLVAMMIGAGAVGTWVGLKLLNKLPTQVFFIVFKLLITVLALRLSYLGVYALVMSGTS